MTMEFRTGRRPLRPRGFGVFELTEEEKANTQQIKPIEYNYDDEEFNAVSERLRLYQSEPEIFENLSVLTDMIDKRTRRAKELAEMQEGLAKREIDEELMPGFNNPFSNLQDQERHGEFRKVLGQVRTLQEIHEAYKKIAAPPTEEEAKQIYKEIRQVPLNEIEDKYGRRKVQTLLNNDTFSEVEKRHETLLNQTLSKPDIIDIDKFSWKNIERRRKEGFPKLEVLGDKEAFDFLEMIKSNPKYQKADADKKEQMLIQAINSYSPYHKFPLNYSAQKENEKEPFDPDTLSAAKLGAKEIRKMTFPEDSEELDKRTLQARKDLLEYVLYFNFNEKNNQGRWDLNVPGLHKSGGYIDELIMEDKKKNEALLQIRENQKKESTRRTPSFYSGALTGDLGGKWITIPVENDEVADRLISNIRHADAAMENIRKLKYTPEFKSESGFWSNLGYTSAEEILSLGIKEMFDLGDIHRIIKKANNNEELSFSEEALLSTAALLGSAEAKDTAGRWARVGRNMTPMLPYIATFSLTGPSYTATRAAIMKGTTANVKQLAKRQIKQESKKKFSKEVMELAGKKYTMKEVATLSLARSAGAAAQTLSAPQYIVSNTLRRMQDDIDFITDPATKELMTVIDKNSGEGFSEALWKGFAEAYAEMFTERMGGHIMNFTGLNKAKDYLGKKLLTTLGEIPKMEKIAKAQLLSAYLKRKGYKDTHSMLKEITSSQLGWHGVFEEFSEEFFNSYIGFVTGDMELKDLASKKYWSDQLDMFLTVAIFGGFANTFRFGTEMVIGNEVVIPMSEYRQAKGGYRIIKEKVSFGKQLWNEFAAVLGKDGVNREELDKFYERNAKILTEQQRRAIGKMVTSHEDKTLATIIAEKELDRNKKKEKPGSQETTTEQEENQPITEETSDIPELTFDSKSDSDILLLEKNHKKEIKDLTEQQARFVKTQRRLQKKAEKGELTEEEKKELKEASRMIAVREGQITKLNKKYQKDTETLTNKKEAEFNANLKNKEDFERKHKEAQEEVQGKHNELIEERKELEEELKNPEITPERKADIDGRINEIQNEYQEAIANHERRVKEIRAEHPETERHESTPESRLSQEEKEKVDKANDEMVKKHPDLAELNLLEKDKQSGQYIEPTPEYLEELYLSLQRILTEMRQKPENYAEYDFFGNPINQSELLNDLLDRLALIELKLRQLDRIDKLPWDELMPSEKWRQLSLEIAHKPHMKGVIKRRGDHGMIITLPGGREIVGYFSQRPVSAEMDEMLAQKNDVTFKYESKEEWNADNKFKDKSGSPYGDRITVIHDGKQIGSIEINDEFTKKSLKERRKKLKESIEESLNTISDIWSGKETNRADIEAKKAEIERRRQEELKFPEQVLDENYDSEFQDKSSKQLLRDSEKQIQEIGNRTKRPAAWKKVFDNLSIEQLTQLITQNLEIHHRTGTINFVTDWANELTIAEEVRKEKINNKYDAELAALEKSENIEVRPEDRGVDPKVLQIKKNIEILEKERDEEVKRAINEDGTVNEELADQIHREYQKKIWDEMAKTPPAKMGFSGPKWMIDTETRNKLLQALLNLIRDKVESMKISLEDVIDVLKYSIAHSPKFSELHKSILTQMVDENRDVIINHLSKRKLEKSKKFIVTGTKLTAKDIIVPSMDTPHWTSQKKLKSHLDAYSKIWKEVSDQLKIGRERVESEFIKVARSKRWDEVVSENDIANFIEGERNGDPIRDALLDKLLYYNFDVLISMFNFYSNVRVLKNLAIKVDRDGFEVRDLAAGVSYEEFVHTTLNRINNYEFKTSDGKNYKGHLAVRARLAIYGAKTRDNQSKLKRLMDDKTEGGLLARTALRKEQHESDLKLLEEITGISVDFWNDYFSSETKETEAYDKETKSVGSKKRAFNTYQELLEHDTFNIFRDKQGKIQVYPKLQSDLVFNLLNLKIEDTYNESLENFFLAGSEENNVFSNLYKLSSALKKPSEFALSAIDVKGDRISMLVQYNMVLKIADEIQNDPRSNRIIDFYKALGIPMEVVMMNGMFGKANVEGKTAADLTLQDIMLASISFFAEGSNTYLGSLGQYGDKGALYFAMMPKEQMPTEEQIAELKKIFPDFDNAVEWMFKEVLFGNGEKLQSILSEYSGIGSKGLKELAAHFIYNYALNTQAILETINGSLDQYDNSLVTMVKRAGSANSPGYRLNTNIEGGVGKEYTHAILNDTVTHDLGFESKIFDGVVFMSGDMSSKIAKSMGAVYNKLGLFGGVLDSSKILSSFIDKKSNRRGLLKGNWLNIELLANAMPGSVFEQIYNLMNENNLDTLSFTSTNKLIETTSVPKSPFENNGKIREGFKLEQSDIITRNTEDLYVQQDLRHESDPSSTKQASQFLANILILPNAGKIVQAIAESRTRQVKEFLSKFDQASTEERVKLLKESKKAWLMESLNEVQDAELIGLLESNASFEEPGIQAMIRSRIAVAATRRALDLNMMRTATQEIPDADGQLEGFRLSSDGKHYLLPEAAVGDPTARVHDYRFEGKIQEAINYVSHPENKSRYVDLFDNEGKLMEWEIRDRNGVIPGEVQMLTRVPADHPHSHTIARIKFRLPGNFTMLDKQSQIRSGSDFDGDARYNTSFFKNKNGEIITGSGKSALANSILQNLIYDYTNPALNEYINTPIDTGVFDSIAEKYRKDRTIDPLNPKSFYETRNDNMVGVKLKGIFTDINTLFSIMSVNKMAFKQESVLKIGEKEYNLAGFVNDQFGAMKIAIVNLQNMAFDNAADPKLEAMGINEHSVMMFMTMLMMNKKLDSSLFENIEDHSKAIYNAVEDLADLFNSKLMKDYVELKKDAISQSKSVQLREIMDLMIGREERGLYIEKKETDKKPSSSVANIPQNLVSGIESFGTKQEANSKAKEILGNSPHSIDMIEAGLRTRTTRSKGEIEKYNVKVGDIVTQFGKSADGTTKQILTRITAIHPKGTPGFLGTWDKEGWTQEGIKAIERFKDGAAAIEFEIVKPSITLNPEKEIVSVPSKISTDDLIALIQLSNALNELGVFLKLTKEVPDNISDFQSAEAIFDAIVKNSGVSEAFSFDSINEIKEFRGKRLVISQDTSKDPANDIVISKKLIKSLYEARIWENPGVQPDGSQATPLPQDAFANRNEFTTFYLIREHYLKVNPKSTGETTGAYYNRINAISLSDLYENYNTRKISGVSSIRMLNTSTLFNKNGTLKALFRSAEEILKLGREVIYSDAIEISPVGRQITRKIIDLLNRDLEQRTRLKYNHYKAISKALTNYVAVMAMSPTMIFLEIEKELVDRFQALREEYPNNQFLRVLQKIKKTGVERKAIEVSFDLRKANSISETKTARIRKDFDALPEYTKKLFYLYAVQNFGTAVSTFSGSYFSFIGLSYRAEASRRIESEMEKFKNFDILSPLEKTFMFEWILRTSPYLEIRNLAGIKQKGKVTLDPTTVPFLSIPITLNALIDIEAAQNEAEIKEALKKHNFVPNERGEYIFLGERYKDVSQIKKRVEGFEEKIRSFSEQRFPEISDRTEEEVKNMFDNSPLQEAMAVEDVALQNFILWKLQQQYPGVQFFTDRQAFYDFVQKNGGNLRNVSTNAIGHAFKNAQFIDLGKAKQSTRLHEQSHIYWDALPDSSPVKKKLLDFYRKNKVHPLETEAEIEERIITDLGRFGTDRASIEFKGTLYQKFMDLVRQFWAEVKNLLGIAGKTDLLRLMANHIWENHHQVGTLSPFGQSIVKNMIENPEGIVYKDEGHVYEIGDTPIISTTGIIAKTKPHFDAEYQAEKMAQADMMNLSKIINKGEAIPQGLEEKFRRRYQKGFEISQNIGTAIHKIAEHVFDGTDIPIEALRMYKDFDSKNPTKFPDTLEFTISQITEFKDALHKAFGKNIKIVSEKIIGSKKYGVAGTADLVVEIGQKTDPKTGITEHQLVLFDFKTSQDPIMSKDAVEGNSDYKKAHGTRKDIARSFPISKESDHGLQLHIYKALFEEQRDPNKPKERNSVVGMYILPIEIKLNEENLLTGARLEYTEERSEPSNIFDAKMNLYMQKNPAYENRIGMIHFNPLDPKYSRMAQSLLQQERDMTIFFETKLKSFIENLQKRGYDKYAIEEMKKAYAYLTRFMGDLSKITAAKVGYERESSLTEMATKVLNLGYTEEMFNDKKRGWNFEHMFYASQYGIKPEDLDKHFGTFSLRKEYKPSKILEHETGFYRLRIKDNEIDPNGREIFLGDAGTNQLKEGDQIYKSYSVETRTGYYTMFYEYSIKSVNKSTGSIHVEDAEGNVLFFNVKGDSGVLKVVDKEQQKNKRFKNEFSPIEIYEEIPRIEKHFTGITDNIVHKSEEDFKGTKEEWNYYKSSLIRTWDFFDNMNKQINEKGWDYVFEEFRDNKDLLQKIYEEKLRYGHDKIMGPLRKFVGDILLDHYFAEAIAEENKNGAVDFMPMTMQFYYFLTLNPQTMFQDFHPGLFGSFIHQFIFPDFISGEYMPLNFLQSVVSKAQRNAGVAKFDAEVFLQENANYVKNNYEELVFESDLDGRLYWKRPKEARPQKARDFLKALYELHGKYDKGFTAREDLNYKARIPVAYVKMTKSELQEEHGKYARELDELIHSSPYDNVEIDMVKRSKWGTRWTDAKDENDKVIKTTYGKIRREFAKKILNKEDLFESFGNGMQRFFARHSLTAGFTIHSGSQFHYYRSKARDAWRSSVKNRDAAQFASKVSSLPSLRGVPKQYASKKYLEGHMDHVSKMINNFYMKDVLSPYDYIKQQYAPKKAGNQSSIFDHIEGTIDVWLFKNHNEYQVTTFMKSLANFMIRWASMVYMMYQPKTQAFNFMIGHSQNMVYEPQAYINGMRTLFFTRNNNTKSFVRGLYSNYQKAYKIISRYGLANMVQDTEFQKIDRYFKKLGKTKVSAETIINYGYWLLEKAEKTIQIPIFIGMMTKEEWKAYDNNGQVINEKNKLTEARASELTRRVGYIHGFYAKHQSSSAALKPWGAAVFQFKKFLPSLYYKMFGKYRYDANYQIRSGILQSLVTTMKIAKFALFTNKEAKMERIAEALRSEEKKQMENVPFYIKGINDYFNTILADMHNNPERWSKGLKNLPKSDIRNLVSAGIQASMVAMYTLIHNYYDDEKDQEKSALFEGFLVLLFRAQADMIYYFKRGNYQEMAESIAAAVTLIVSLMNVSALAVAWLWNTSELEDLTGWEDTSSAFYDGDSMHYYQGMPKFIYRIGDVIPAGSTYKWGWRNLYGQFLKMQDQLYYTLDENGLLQGETKINPVTGKPFTKYEIRKEARKAETWMQNMKLAIEAGKVLENNMMYEDYAEEKELSERAKALIRRSANAARYQQYKQKLADEDEEALRLQEILEGNFDEAKREKEKIKRQTDEELIRNINRQRSKN